MNEPRALADASRAVDAAMERFMDGRTLPLYRMMGYHLGWVDENGEPVRAARHLRLRGAVCLLSAAAVAGTPGRKRGAADGTRSTAGGGGETDPGSPALQHAVAIELVHNYSQMHTDVQEGNNERGGRPAVWWVWGPAQAINAGDGMHALARLALFGLGERGVPPDRVAGALRVLDAAALRLCEGSYYDTVYQERLTVPIGDYLAMAAGVAGALVGCATRLGALAAGEEDAARLDAIEAFGTKLGTSMRLASDYAAFWPEGERGNAAQGRLLSKKKSLPVVHALDEGRISQKRALGELYAQRVLDPGDVARIAAILEETGSRSFTEQALARLRSEANAALQSAGVSQECALPLLEALEFAGRGTE